jgi:hypothetical protein
MCDETVYGPPLNTHCSVIDGPAAVRISTRAAHWATKPGRNCDGLSRLSYVVYSETAFASVETLSRVGWHLLRAESPLDCRSH